MATDIPKEWLYPPSLEEAARAQRMLAERVIARDALPPDCKRFGGTDVSNNPYDSTNRIYAALVILEKEAIQEGVLPKPASRADVWRICETATRVETATLPYRPGFLGFREAPALVRAYRELHAKPDVLLVDGHGISHPRGLGIASHIGVLLDVPTIGVAKSILVGRPESEEALEPGFGVPLVWRGRQIGLALQTKRRSTAVVHFRGAPDQPGDSRPYRPAMSGRLPLARADAAGASGGQHLPSGLKPHRVRHLTRIRMCKGPFVDFSESG